MILDYEYDQRNKKFTISYINPKGTKSFYEFNINRFKSYYPCPTGKFQDWDGTKVDVRYTDRPSKFDIMEFVEDLPENIKEELFNENCIPKVYTWDIETEFDPNEKPDPASAKFPITAISCVSPEMKVMVLGTKPLDSTTIDNISKYIKDYCSGILLCQESKIVPEFIYKKFDNEHDMLQWFVKNVIAKVPILAGWNSDGFDQQYITNRIKNYYDDISLYSMSCRGRMGVKKIINTFHPNDDMRIPSPRHTLMVDMMDIIKTHDMTILPIKESMSLDWIADQSLGVKKIKYDGDLNELYTNDPERFFFYNAIDSVLVQLIHKRFRTLNLIFNYANVTHLPIDKCFGKIGPAEALFFQNFHNKGYHIVYYPDRHVERGELPGAYVKEPIAGQYQWACCFDFASLYPTQVMTCNLSVENFVTPPRSSGWTEDELNIYKSDPNYFVSINGNVYKNDKDYAFREIQIFLKKNRNTTKYLAKEMDAQVMSVIERVINTKSNGDWSPFSDDVKSWMMKNYNISSKRDVVAYPDLEDLKYKVKTDIDNMISREQSFKLLGNSCYGGSSHPAFYWYNMSLAADITGESRSLIHMMEDKTQKVFDKWTEMTDVHKMLGVTIDKTNFPTNCVSTIYQDTDSVAGDTILHTSNGDKTIEELYNENIDNPAGNTLMGHESVKCDDKLLNYHDDGNLLYDNVRRVIRHKVSKKKWRLRTASGKEVICTNDHSLVVFREGKKCIVKPYEIQRGDKVIVNNNTYIFEDIEVCECIGEFEDEYVYDIEMDDDSHTFIANDILVHNSSYVNLGPIVDSIIELRGADDKEKCKFCVEFADKFMNNYFAKILDEYFTPRHVKNRHFFELETVAKTGIWIGIKKRYAQALLWKDGRYYDEPKMKVKGLEVIKGSYPSFSRKILKDLTMTLLTENIHDSDFIHKFNAKVMDWKDKFMKQDPDLITEAISVSNYWKGVESDDDPSGVKILKGAPYNVKALALYNWMINAKKKPGDTVYNGKVRCYLVQKTNAKSEDTYFAYPTGGFPSWAPPIDRNAMYTKTVLEPINRIITKIGLPELTIDGAIQVDLFSMF